MSSFSLHAIQGIVFSWSYKIPHRMTDSINSCNNRNLESSGRIQMDLSGMGVRGNWYINRLGKGGSFFTLDAAVDTLRRDEGVLYELRRLWFLSRQALHRSRKY